MIRRESAIKGQQLTVLIDSESTHNFVQKSVAHNLGIPLQELSEFRFFIGSGDYLICREVCRQVTIMIQEAAIIQDLFVLGVQWLETLGTVRTDYKKLTLEFECREDLVKLQGDSQIADSMVTNRGLRRMMTRKEVAYFYHLAGEPPELPTT